MTGAFQTLLKRPWIWSFVGAGVVWLAAIAFTSGYGAGGMLTAALSWRSSPSLSASARCS